MFEVDRDFRNPEPSELVAKEPVKPFFNFKVLFVLFSESELRLISCIGIDSGCGLVAVGSPRSTSSLLLLELVEAVESLSIVVVATCLALLRSEIIVPI
jgi:hypothetical protein